MDYMALLTFRISIQPSESPLEEVDCIYPSQRKFQWLPIVRNVVSRRVG
jgi:hypothetical protein